MEPQPPQTNPQIPEYPYSIQTEKQFEAIFQDGCVVYFLEPDGTWWKNTFQTSDIAQAVYNSFTKSA